MKDYLTRKPPGPAFAGVDPGIGKKDLLRLVTAGSIDDGKSTLIGRLLYESMGIYEDQLDSVKKYSSRKGFSEPDLSLIVDGLKAEREQKITIDVAYRYFSTPKRKFIIADTPGHVQYTRNMVTGASTANLAILLVDARKGMLEQTRRHTFILSLLDISHIVVAVNKMDLVDYSEEVFNKIKDDYIQFARKLQVHDIELIPISALKGDMIVKRGINLDWYQGRTLLSFLEEIPIVSDRNLIDFRFPVQIIIRPDHGYRGYAGKIVSGIIQVGDDVVALPSGHSSRISSIITFNGKTDYAFVPQSVVLTLEDELDISRGDMIVRKRNVPLIGKEFEAEMFWMDEEEMVPGKKYLIKHTTNITTGIIKELRYRININTLHREDASTLSLNEIGRVIIKTQKPVFYDPYARNKSNGSFIIINQLTKSTAGAGIIWYQPGRLPNK